MNAIRGENGLESDQNVRNHLKYAEQAQLRAEMYRFLANMFNQRPNAEFVIRLRTLGLNMFASNKDEEIHPDIATGFQEMVSFVEATSKDKDEQVEQALAVDWTRLFRGVSPSYGPPPPYEGVHTGEKSNQAQILQSVTGFYHEHSVEVSEESDNRPDYIGIELEFLCHISEREAEAWEQGENESALHYQAVSKNFLENHLGRWAWKFCDLAIEEAKTDFYRGFLRVTKGVLNEEIGTVV
jgi:TorA maturation chaperone TorD